MKPSTAWVTFMPVCWKKKYRPRTAISGKMPGRMPSSVSWSTKSLPDMFQASGVDSVTYLAAMMPIMNRPRTPRALMMDLMRPPFMISSAARRPIV